MTNLPSWVAEAYEEYATETAKGRTTTDVATDILSSNRELTINVETFTRYMRWHKRNMQEGGSADDSHANSVPPPISDDNLPALIVDYEDCFIFGDWHIPLHNKELVEYGFKKLRKSKATAVVISGDFMDLEWASKFISWGGQASPKKVKQEFKIARKILNSLLSIVDKIYIIPGNHDGGRFKNMSNGSLGFELLLSAIVGPEALEEGRIQFTERRWMIMKGSPYGDWRITHPAQGRAMPLSLAQVLAQKYKMNLITAHQHYLGMAYDKTGEYICVDGGHMQEEQLADYMIEVDSTHSRWVPGFVELRGGWPHLHPGPVIATGGRANY